MPACRYVGIARMKLLFDLQGLQNGSRNRGIGRYVRSLFDALARREDIELFALLNGSIADTLGPVAEYAAGKLDSNRVFVFPGTGDTEEQFHENTHRRKLGEAAYEAFVASTGIDVLLVGTAIEGFGDNTCLSLRDSSATYIKSVVLYDLIPLLNPDSYLGDLPTKAWYADRVDQVQSADLLLAISESSRLEAVENLSISADACVSISTAIDNDIFTLDGPRNGSILQRLGIAKPFVMHASAIEPRKNFDGLIKAFAMLPEKVRKSLQLVLVGVIHEPMRMHLLRVAFEAGLSAEDVVMPGYVPDPELAELYRSCSLFVFPSFHEGFGLPALEAMACGCATIGSNLTSVPEVIGDPSYTFDPSDTVAMSKLMRSLLSNKKALAAARKHAVSHAATFDWDIIGERTVAVLKKAIAGREPAQAPAYPSARRMAKHVAARVNLASIPMDDLATLARCLALAEDHLGAIRAAGVPKKGKPWRIEGPFDSTYSLALVNRETARAMAKLGWRVALHSTEGPGDYPANPEFLAANPDLAAMHKLAAQGSHKRSVAVSRLLYPPRVADMAAPINALNHYAWEESGFPQAWVDEFNSSLTMMTTLSTHIEKIMIDNGVTVPILTSGCGVDHWDRIEADESYSIEARSFRFLHVSSCFPRKGVDALLAAYGSAFSIDDNVTLVIKTFDNPHNDVREQLADYQARNPHYPHVVLIFGDVSDRQLKALYGQCHVMVGPSFAEGYGLPFAEAMLTGIPVITTNWGGQLDFCNAGNSWLVDYRFERAQTHFGLWASAWARADVGSLVEAMQDAYRASPEQRSAMAARGREQLLGRHRWKHIAERLTAAAATLPVKPQREPRIGWITTWQSKCGIASYSEHLVRCMPGKITIFAPVNETPQSGKDEAIRCWKQGKEDSELWRVLMHPMADEIDTFVIQFNFGFFNHADLARFIAKAEALGKSVVICLHSTVDNPHTSDVANWHLAWLAPALARCDRVLVHSFDDLNRLKQLGLVDNVCLFPHGVVRREGLLASVPKRSGKAPLIATYGFALPNKGLVEIVEAMGLLRDRGHPVKLRMVNAEYPAEVSAQLVQELKARIRDHDLGERVELYNKFLPDEESFALLADCDLIVYPYQDTGESSSAAVRYGLAAERPVAVTPLAIFNDVEGAVWRFAGVSPADLADGIANTLEALVSSTPEVASVAAKAELWRDQHDYKLVSRRLYGILCALRQKA